MATDGLKSTYDYHLMIYRHLNAYPSGKVAHVTCMLHASYMRRVLCMLP